MNLVWGNEGWVGLVSVRLGVMQIPVDKSDLHPKP